MTRSNAEQQDFWDQRAEAWERRADALDGLSDRYGEVVLDALGLEPGHRVVDVGCGPGSTTIELGRRVGPSGHAVGVDISPAMVAAATRRAAAADVANVEFRVADAQGDSLGGPYDAAFSRFGVMFFADPVAAFTNIRRSLAAGGRLACAVWGPLDENPWMFLPTLAATEVLHAALTVPEAGRPGPFSLDQTDRINEILEGAGFVGVAVEPVKGLRHITSDAGGDNASTLLEVGPLGEAYARADQQTRDLATAAVLTALEPFRTGGGWDIPGLALKVTATSG